MEKREIIGLLEETSPGSADRLYRRAREQRAAVFGDKIFLSGFVYFSTWCRNDCNFCYYRKSNHIQRYRKTPAEIFAIAKSLKESGVNFVDLTMGEDLVYHDEAFQSVLQVIKRIKEELAIPVMISPGVVGHDLIDALAALGTDWYALYQETHNRDLFKRLRKGQSYEERMDAKLYAKSKGMLIEEGLLAGAGETLEDIADSLLTMGEIGAAQVRVMSFIPQAGTPMESAATPDRELELKIIALMRILYPKAIIPASLDVDGISGLVPRILAGANLVTSIIPPQSGLMGVAQSTMDVDEGGRTVKEVTEILESIRLRPASTDEYRSCLDRLHREEA